MSRVKEKVREAKFSAGAVLSPVEKNRSVSRPLYNAEEDYVGRDQDPSDGEIPAKDETEERLEKLLFGDDEGFHEALRSHRGHQMTDIATKSDDEGVSGDDEDAGEDQEMDDVADADVSGPSRE